MSASMPLRPPAFLTTLCLCAFVHPLFAQSAAPEAVKLPTLSVNERLDQNADHPSLVLAADGQADGAFAGLARQVAGLAVNDSGARGFGQTVTLRGLGNTPFFGDASVPVYLDDIPLASGFTFPTELYDFGRMTVYRGPQAATLFGRAGDAGVIQFTSTAPGASGTARLGATVGSYGQLAFNVSAQTARSTESDVSAQLGTSRRDGYIENTLLKQTVDDRRAVFGRVQLHYRPAPDLELSLHLLGQQSRDGAQALVPLGGPYYEVSRGKEGVSDTDFAAIAAGLTKRLAGATLTATTSYSDWNLSPYSNRLVVFGGVNFDSALTQSQRTFNEELRYAGEHLTLGAFYSTSRTRGAADRIFNGFPVEGSAFTTDADLLALSGRATFTPAPGWSITPGLRVEHTAKEFERIETIPSSTVMRRDDAWPALLPSIVVGRRFDETTDFTLTLGRGFKPGGYSAYTGRADLAGFGPESSWSLEAAVTAAPRDSNLSCTARAYVSRVSGYQIERSFAVPGATADEYLVVNASRARVLGVELESVWRAGHDISVTLAASVSRATLEDFTDPFTGATYSGRQAPYAPAGNGALRVDYRPATGFFAGAGLTWTGTTYYDEKETASLAQRSYSLVDAEAGYAFARGDIRLFGRNLTDKAYYSAIIPGVKHGTPGAPATWGAALALRW
jgi:iron complex outermembrane receptor protein